MTQLVQPSESLRAILGRLDPGVVVREMYLRLREIPTYARYVDADPEGRGQVAIRWNVALVLRWLSDGVAPDTDMLAELVEVVRPHAAANEPIEDGLLVYRRGVRILWNTLLDIASDDERPILLEQAEILWTYLDLVIDAFGKAYADHQVSPGTVGERWARLLLDHLCSDLPITVEDRDRASRLGFELRSEFRPFSASVVGAGIEDHINLAARLRDLRVLATTEGSRVTGTHVGRLRLECPPRGRPGGPGLRQTGPARPPRPGPRRPSRAYEIRSSWPAELGLSPQRTSFLNYFSPGLQRSLPSSPDRVFDGLEGANNAELVMTLRSLAANGFDKSASASALIIHRNTLLYRINRIEKLTDLDLQSHADRELVYLALMWTDIGGSFWQG